MLDNHYYRDTSPFVEMYFSNADNHIYDWCAVTSPKVYTANLLEDLEMELKESRAKWKIVTLLNLKILYGREKLHVDFVISTGDNFYNNGITSSKDPGFVDPIAKVYTARRLQKPR
ncbi:unnamed protein product [Camellia sinensis]